MIRLGAFEHLLLLALVRLGDDTYGVPIRDENRGAGQAGSSRREPSTPRSIASTPRPRPLAARGPDARARRQAQALLPVDSKRRAAVRDAQNAMTHMTHGIKPKLQTP